MGYETERFLGKVHESLICGICLDVFKDPVELDECQHVFCRDCIGEQLASNAVCPQDRYEINDESLVTPHRYFFDIYNDLKIKCQFYEDGCKAVVSLCDFANHVDNCDFNVADCAKECGFRSSRKRLRTHDCVQHLKKRIRVMSREMEVTKNEAERELSDCKDQVSKLRAEKEILEKALDSDFILEKQELRKVVSEESKKTLRMVLKRIKEKSGASRNQSSRHD